MPIQLRDLNDKIPSSVNNNAVWQVYNLLRRAYGELIYCESANQGSGMTTADLDAVKTNLLAVREKIAHVQNVIERPLDLPEIKVSYALQPLDEFQAMDSTDVPAIASYLQTGAVQWVNSQSLKTDFWVHPKDIERLLATLDMVDDYLDNYLANATPQDLTKTVSRTPPIYPPPNVGIGEEPPA